MVLLVTASEKAQQCAARITHITGERVEVAGTVAQAAARLRAAEYTVLVLDHLLLDAHPQGGRVLLDHAGSAVPVPVNLAITGCERLLGEVRTALQRRQREHRLATQAAATSLRAELKTAVTGILLSTELALADPDVPQQTTERLRTVHQFASQIRERLGA
jgi:hypothetical protein